MDKQIQAQFYQWKLENLYTGNQFLGITLTPKGKKVTMKDVIRRYKGLTSLKSIKDMIVIEETSDHGLNHMHGIALVKYPSKYSRSPELVFRTKNLYNIRGWSNYCTKGKPTVLHRIKDNEYSKYRLQGERILYCPQTITINPHLTPFIVPW